MSSPFPRRIKVSMWNIEYVKSKDEGAVKQVCSSCETLPGALESRKVLD